MKALLLLLFWLWLTPQEWGGGSKKDPPYFSNYNMDFIKNTQTLWGRMVTTCANATGNHGASSIFLYLRRHRFLAQPRGYAFFVC